VIHRASREFWELFASLPPSVQSNAKRAFELLQRDPRHPSLRFKKVGQYWSARVGLGYRALGRTIDEGVLWGWIGPHDEYDKIT
jgi:hypothetical protein